VLVSVLDLRRVQGFIVKIGDADLDVDNRRGGQAGNRRGADVLDSQRGARMYALEPIAPPLVASRGGQAVAEPWRCCRSAAQS
jgi:hypothetical protein